MGFDIVHESWACLIPFGYKSRGEINAPSFRERVLCADVPRRPVLERDLFSTVTPKNKGAVRAVKRARHHHSN